MPPTLRGCAPQPPRARRPCTRSPACSARSPRASSPRSAARLPPATSAPADAARRGRVEAPRAGSRSSGPSTSIVLTAKSSAWASGPDRAGRRLASEPWRKPQASCSPAGDRRGWELRRPRSSGTARRSCAASPESSAARSTGRSWSCALPARRCPPFPRASRSSRTPARAADRCRASLPGSPPSAAARRRRVRLVDRRAAPASALRPPRARCARRRHRRRPPPDRRLPAAARRGLPDRPGRRRRAPDRRRPDAPGVSVRGEPRPPPRRGGTARGSHAGRARPGPRLGPEPQRTPRLRGGAHAAGARGERCGCSASCAGSERSVAIRRSCAPPRSRRPRTRAA